MKPYLILSFVLLSGIASAEPISVFSDVNTYLKRGKDIVIAKCRSFPEKDEATQSGYGRHPIVALGMRPVEVDVVRIIKGGIKPGKHYIVTIYPMKIGNTYLLYSSGGRIDSLSPLPRIDFLALAELSVIELPAQFALTELDGKPLREQILIVFLQGLTLLDASSASNNKAPPQTLSPFSVEHETHLLEMATTEDKTADVCKAYLREKYRYRKDDTPRTIVTKDKQIFAGAVISSYDSKVATISYDEGVASVPRGRLPDDIRLKLDLPTLVERFIESIEGPDRDIYRWSSNFRGPDDASQADMLKRVDEYFGKWGIQ